MNIISRTILSSLRTTNRLYKSPLITGRILIRIETTDDEIFERFFCNELFGQSDYFALFKNLTLSASIAVRYHGEYEWQDPKSDDEIVNIIFINKDHKRIPIRGKIGDNLLYLGHRYAVEIEGACEASLACSTCHVYVKEEYLHKLPDPKEEEEDQLDLAAFLKSNSRLGCQIILKKDLEGAEFTLPQATRNYYVDGHKPAPH